MPHDNVHGHSTIIRLLDDIQTHAAVLGDPLETSIIDDLKAYVSQLNRELQAHVEFEETDVFPDLLRSKPLAVKELRRQHAGILLWMSRLEHLLTHEPLDTEDIAMSARLLLREFLNHSHDERQILAL